jgi:hypothetical protein
MCEETTTTKIRQSGTETLEVTKSLGADLPAGYSCFANFNTCSPPFFKCSIDRSEKDYPNCICSTDFYGKRCTAIDWVFDPLSICDYFCTRTVHSFLTQEPDIVFHHDSCSGAPRNIDIYGTSLCTNDDPVFVKYDQNWKRDDSSFFTNSNPREPTWRLAGNGIEMMLNWNNPLSWVVHSPWKYTKDDPSNGNFKEASSIETGYPFNILTMCLSKTISFNPPNQDEDGQLWRASDRAPITFRNMRRCQPGDDSEYKVFVTFEIRSVSANGLCMTNVAGFGGSAFLRNCDKSLSQQWFLDSSGNLLSAVSPNPPMFTNLRWTADGVFRKIGVLPTDGQALVFPSDLNQPGRIINCESTAEELQACPVDAHQRFVIPSEYPTVLANAIRDAPLFEEQIIIPPLDAGPVQTVENIASLTDCEGLCNVGECSAVEYTELTQTCKLQIGETQSVVLPKSGSTIGIPHTILPYRRIFNAIIDENSFLWFEEVSQLSECYALCDGLSLCRTFTLDLHGNCRMYRDPPSNGTDYNNSYTNIRMYNHIRRLPKIPSFLGYPARDILIVQGVDSDECTTLCRTSSQCRVVGVTYLSDGTPECRINTRERTQPIQLESLNGGLEPNV